MLQHHPRTGAASERERSPTGPPFDSPHVEVRPVARKPNYDFEKRRKEQARKEKQEEKRARRRAEQERASTEAADAGEATSAADAADSSEPASE